MRGIRFAAGALLAMVGSLSRADTPLTTTRVASGLVRPIWVTHAPGDTSRVFIIEKQGRIRILELATNTLRPTSFLDIDAITTGGTTTNSEQGLLGLTFHPNYAQNGKFYVYYTAVAGSGDLTLAEYTVSGDPNVADGASANPILVIDDPQANHNGGWIAFGDDGYLYVAVGDGGAANDTGSGHSEPGGNAQDITSNLLGKMLRLDVNGDDFPADASRDYSIPPTNPFVDKTGDDEIWAYGLRNPWRNSFDRETGELYIADVGQSAWEEINIQPAASVGGENYGWRCMEGNACTGLTGCTCNDNALTDPVYTYSHASGCSITGGYVYRGCAVPDLRGTYFFSDYCSDTIWSFRYVGGAVTDFRDRTAELDPAGSLSILSITSYGEDADGELYICDQDGGEVFKIVPVTLVDCNSNGVADGCDISKGTSVDRNGDGVPDECDCPADFNNDGFPTGDDFDAYVEAFLEGDIAADYNGDGFVTGDDFDGFNESFEAGC